MNRVEFAACRIRQILPKNEGSLTRGSGCVVKCEWLSSARGWKCPYLLVTSSNVLHRDEIASGKVFVADFLLKDKKGLETFDLKLAADTCVDIPGRPDISAKEQSMTIISVEKLDKRGFLRRMAKKSSLQTTRPLECFDTAKLNDELNEGLYCHVIREADQEFSTRTYKFLFLAETRHFVLQDFGNTEINSIRGFPNDEMPLGAVIYTKRGEFAGLLEFSEERIEPCFFPVEIRLSAEANGEQADQALSNNNASAAQAGMDQADIPDKDGEKRSLDEATNEEEGKDMKQTEDSYDKADVVESHGNSNAAEHQIPPDASTGTTSVEAAHSTVGQSDISVSALQRDDGTVLGVPVFQSSVVAENHDKVVVEVHTKGEELAGSSSELNSCNGVGESPRHEEQNAEVDKIGLDEIVMSGGGAEDNLKNEEGTACELLENTSENQTFVGESTSVSEDTTLITAASTQEERGSVDQSKAEEQGGAKEFLDSTAASEEHSSPVQRTVSNELQSSQAAELNTDKESEDESATAPIQTSAESDTEVSRDCESAKAAHDNLSDEEPAFVNSGAEREEVTNLPGAGTVTDELVDDKADSMSQREQSTPPAICIPGTHIETPSDTHNLDKDTVEDILSTASVVANVEEEKEGEKSPESRHEEPSEKFARVESEEQERNVEEVTGKVEEIEDTGKDETEKEDNQKEGNEDNEDKAGDKEAKSTETTEEKERLEQTELGPAVVQDNEGRERSEEEESTPEQDQEEDKVTTETGEDGETAVTDKEKESEEEESTPEQDQDQEEDKVTIEAGAGEDGETVVADKEEKESEEEESTLEQDQDQEEVKVTTAIDEGEDGETAVTDKEEKESEEKRGKGEEMDKKNCEESEEVQREDQTQDKEGEQERAEGSEGKKNGDAEISTVPEEQTEEEENEGEKITEAQKDEEDEGEEDQDVQVQNRAENDKEDEEVKVHIQGEKDEDNGEVAKAHNDVEKDEEQKYVKVHNQVEKDESEEEEAKVSIRGEKDEEIEVDGNEDHDPRERRKQVPLMKQEEEEEEEEEEADHLSDVVAQRIDADSLLSETITNNSRILDDLARCLDTDYQYSLLPSWRDLADLLAIPAEAYEHYDVYSVGSPTEDLFVFLSTTKPDLTMKDIKEALLEIGRPDVVQIMDKFRTRNLISNESVVGSLVEREDRDLLGKLALKLDRGSTVTWKHLAEQLSIPRRVYRNFGSNQGYNSALLLLKYLPIFDPELTIADLKEVLEKMLRDDVVAVLDSAGIPDDEHVRDILDDAELMDQITDLLNEEAPSPNWRQLAKELKVPREKCQLFEPTEDERSCTKLLFRSLEKSEPDITVEELILALVAMKRQDVLDVLAKYLDGDDIDLILEENNLLLDESHNSLSEDDTAN